MGISRAWLKCASQACCSSLAYQASFSVSACPAHQSTLDQLVEWLGFAGQQPPSLCAAVETALTAWQLGKPGQGEGETEAPWICCVSPKMPPWGRERMAGTSSYHAVQGLASYMSRERIVPGSAQELGSWQRQEESHLYFSVASKGSTTSQWLFYCIIGHLQKGAAFWLSLCVHSRTWATSWENHHRTWRALYIDYSSKLKWSRAWSPSLALQHLHCLTADMFIGTGLIWPIVPGNARVCFDAEECSALMKSLLFWGNTASLYDCKLCHLLWGLQKEPWPALFAGRDIEATTGRFMCKISEILLQVFLIIAMLLN